MEWNIKISNNVNRELQMVLTQSDDISLTWSPRSSHAVSDLIVCHPFCLSLFSYWISALGMYNSTLTSSRLYKIVIIGRKRSLGQGNVFTPTVILFTGGGCIQACSGEDTPRQTPHPGKTPPQADIPLSRHPPGKHPIPLGRYPPWQTHTHRQA